MTDRHLEGQSEGAAEAVAKITKVEAADVRPNKSTLGRRTEHTNLYKERACARSVSDQDAGELGVRELRQTGAEMIP